MVRAPRRLLRIALAAVAATASVAAATVATSVAVIGPVPLGEGLEFSTAVVDRGGKLLRPYTTNDGRWRLPVRPEGVDQRYLDLLIAYEDKHFYEHFGVDPFALQIIIGALILLSVGIDQVRVRRRNAA